MQGLLINRINLGFKLNAPVFLVVKSVDAFVLNKNKAQWIKDRLPDHVKDGFVRWLAAQNLEDNAQLATEFRQKKPEDQGAFIVELTGISHEPFKKEIFKQELGLHLQKKGLLIEPFKIPLSFAAYQKTSQSYGQYDQYCRIDFLWNHKREELSFNFGSESTLITKALESLGDGAEAFDPNKLLVYKSNGATQAFRRCPRDER
jgi:hypothetical protein